MRIKKISIVISTILVFQIIFLNSVFAYSPLNAIQYADDYAQSPNQMNIYGVGYNFYGWSGDCANFVSQSIYNGGFTQDSTWKSIVSFSSNTPHRTDSTTWVNSNTLKNYLKNTRGATKLGSWSRDGSYDPYPTFAYVNNSANLTNANKGKVVLFYDWNGEGTMDHSALFVDNNSTSWCPSEGISGDLIDQHTKEYNNRKRVLWRPDNRQTSTQAATTRVYAFEL